MVGPADFGALSVEYPGAVDDEGGLVETAGDCIYFYA